MRSPTQQGLTSISARIPIFLLLWFLSNAITLLLIIFPFYPDLLDRSSGGFDKYSGDFLFLLLTQTASLLGTIFSFWYMKRRIEKLPIQEFCHFSFPQFLSGGFVGLAIVVGCSLVMAICHFISIQYLGISTLPISILFFVLVAVTEEVVFRGYVLNVLLEGMKPGLAIVLSSLLFTFAHIGNDHFGWIGFVNIFLSGVLLSLVYLKSKDLSAPIGLHFTWNLAQNFFGFAVSGSGIAGLFSLQHHSTNPIITGGQFGLEGSILLTPVVLLAIFLLLKKLPNSISKSLYNGLFDLRSNHTST